MENILFNQKFSQEMFNHNFNEVLKYSNIFIGMFCFIQLIHYIFKMMDYILSEKKYTVQKSDVENIQSINHETIQEQNQDEDKDKDEESSIDDCAEEDCEYVNEFINKYSLDLQNKITEVIYANSELFTDRRSQTRMKYHISKEIIDYFKTVEDKIYAK